MMVISDENEIEWKLNVELRARNAFVPVPDNDEFFFPFQRRKSIRLSNDEFIPFFFQIYEFISFEKG